MASSLPISPQARKFHGPLPEVARSFWTMLKEYKAAVLER